MATKDFRTRDEIIINVGAKRGPGSDAAAKKKRRGGIPTTKPNDGILHRRRTNPIIRFFDLGQIPNGSGGYKDLDFVADPGKSIDFIGSPPRPRFTFNDFTLTHWAELQTKLFEVPLADWADYYRRIEYDDGPKYGVSEYNGRGGFLLDSTTVDHANALYPGTNPEWNVKGLKPINANISIFSFGGLCLGFDTFDAVNYKLTKVRDYAAAAADDFSVLHGADIFLIPNVYWEVLGQSVGIDAAFRRSVLFANWTMKSRELLLAKTARRWFNPPYSEIPIFEGYYLNDRYQSVGPWMFDIDDIGDAFATAISNWTKARGLSTLYVQRGTNASGGATFGYEPLANFPFNTSVGPQAQSVVNLGFFWSMEANAGAFDDINGERYEGAGLLAGIIKTPAGTYYAWRNNVITNAWAPFGGSTSAEMF